MASLSLKTLAVIQLCFLFVYAGVLESLQNREFDCGNGRRITQRFVCDGDNDCENGADEMDCSNVPRYVMDSFNCGHSRLYTETPSRGPSITDVFLKEDASIQSPNYPQNYPHNINIVWNISSVPGHRIKLAFIVKELEDSTDCQYDRLSLYDGNSLSSAPLGVYCRHDEENLPLPTVSSSNSMVVQFTSDRSRTWQGFNITLSTVCGGTFYAWPSENELLSHPKFGDDFYGENNSCDWIIESRPERNVQLSFTFFDVGNGSRSSDTEKLNEIVEVSGCENSDAGNCVQYIADEENHGKDFVEIYDGLDDSSRRLGKYSGDQIPPAITSRGGELLIRFRSGATGSFRGFRAVYQEV